MNNVKIGKGDTISFYGIEDEECIGIVAEVIIDLSGDEIFHVMSNHPEFKDSEIVLYRDDIIRKEKPICLISGMKVFKKEA